MLFLSHLISHLNHFGYQYPPFPTLHTYIHSMVTHLYLLTSILSISDYIYSPFYIQTTLSRYHHTQLRVSLTYTLNYLSIYLLYYSLLFTIGVLSSIEISVVTTIPD